MASYDVRYETLQKSIKEEKKHIVSDTGNKQQYRRRYV